MLLCNLVKSERYIGPKTPSVASFVAFPAFCSIIVYVPIIQSVGQFLGS